MYYVSGAIKKKKKKKNWQMLDLSYHSPQFRDKGKETQKA